MSTNTHSSSSFPSCFHGGTATNPRHYSTAVPPPSVDPNLTTSLYHTQLGLFALTWSRTPLLGRSLHLHHLSSGDSLSPLPSISTPSFSLHLYPFLFWTKSGSKNLTLNTSKPISICWDFSKAKFGSGPEPKSGFFIAVTVDCEIILLVGDSPYLAYAKTKTQIKKSDKIIQSLVLRREHVYRNKLYTTRAEFGGKSREITIDCRIGEEQRLCFLIDNKRVLMVKHLKWKFRGNERIEVDGIDIRVSWDVYNWLFDDDEDGYALFMFRFEKLGGFEKDDGNCFLNEWNHEKNSYGFGFEAKKMKKNGIFRPARSSSAASSSAAALSSASSSCSSVMEWASVEENELKGPSGFSLMVYAWKS
ncbi:hypothetical protein LguiA_036544 [Lonicera macranthoides]